MAFWFALHKGAICNKVKFKWYVRNVGCFPYSSYLKGKNEIIAGFYELCYLEIQMKGVLSTNILALSNKICCS